MTDAGGQLTAFVRRNRRRSRRIERRLPYATPKLRTVYAETVARFANARDDQTVVDLGAGRTCPFAPLLDPDRATRLIGVDVAAEEIEANTDVHEKVIVPPGAPLPFGDGEIDLLVSRSVLEHVDAVAPVLAEVRRVLAPGGHTVHIFPSKRAPFAVLNRILPRRLSLLLLRTLIPGSAGRLGFRAHYDHCTASQMESLLRRSGFEVVETRVSYYQSDYFGFLLPLYLLSVAYERTIRALGRRDLAATVLVVARKPPV